MFLRFDSIFNKVLARFKSVTLRNCLIIKAITLSFFIFMLLSIIMAFVFYLFAPDLLEKISSFTQLAFDVENIPSPFTLEFFSFIFLNNSGHFWNPVRMIVWIPFAGPLLLGFEVFLNSLIIGVVVVIVGITNGFAYPIVGILPHGIIEIPAFLLQISSIVLWQTIIIDAIITKLRGKSLKRVKIKRGLQDVLVLAIVSILFLFIAALIETFVTPYLLSLG